MSRVRAFAVLACLLASIVATPARADVQRIASDGTVFRVDLEPWVQSGRVNGTVLRWTRQAPKGGTDLSNVPGTDDAAVERDPALEIDPSGGLPVLVWARYEGPGSNLYFSRFDGSWSTPRLVAKMDGDAIEPQIRFDARYLHLSWRQEYGGQTTYWRSSFLATTLEPAFGPERVPSDDTPPASFDTGSVDAPDAPAGATYFCGSVFNRAPGDPGRATIWGVRDEPVPITYRQSFVLPADVRSVARADAGYVGGRFTFWFTTPDNRMYYTTLDAGRWAEMRVVELTAQVSIAEARLLLTELNRRLSAGGR